MIKFLAIACLIIAGCASKPDDIVIKNMKGETVYTGTITHHPDLIKDYAVPVIGAGISLVK